MEQLRLQTLGHFGVEGSSFRQPTPLLLLTYLALEGPQIRRRVAELIWMGGNRPLHSLSMAINRLKQGIPGCIETDSERVWTNVMCDASELLDLADKQEFEQCIGLYKGSFLENLNVSLAEELEEWVYGTRDFLALRAREAFLRTAEHEHKQNKPTLAAKYAEQAFLLNKNLGLELEPEHFQRIYTLLLEADHPRAKEVKEEAEEFGIHITTIKRQDETDTKFLTTPNNLPTMQSSFVGRKQELADVAKQFKQDECRLLTFHGMGGIGKSRLAIEAAFEQLEQSSFKDGIYFVALDALSSADLIPIAITEVLNIDLKSIDDTLSQVCEFIGEKQMLLVLDNFEHLIEGALLPSQLLKACPNLKLFVTSREVLNIEEEWVQNLEGLNYPEDATLSLEELKQFDAVDLFMQRAKKAKLEFSLDQDDVPVLVDNCQLVEGAPLALELSAVWVRLMPLAEIAKEIKASIDFLQSQSKNAIERHQSIKAVFEHSWKLLTKKEQDAMRMLAVFVGSFNRQAASEVAGVTLPTLVSLMDKSLLRVLPNGRYTRHFLILEFSRIKLEKSTEDFVHLRKEHAHYYCQYLSGLDETIFGGEQKAILKELELEIENIYSAFPLFFGFKDAMGIRSALINLTEFHSIRGRIQEGLDLYISSINKLMKQNYSEVLVLATLKRCAGWLYFDSGDLSRAQTLTEESLDILRNLPFTNEIAMIYRLLGSIYNAQGKLMLAKDFRLKELNIYQNSNNLTLLSAAMNNLGYLYTKLGLYNDAEYYISESITIDRTEGNLSGLVFNLASLGEMYYSMGKYAEAEQAYKESLEIADELNYTLIMPILLNGLGMTLVKQGQLQAGKLTLNKAYKLALRNNENALARVFTSLASVSIDLKDFASVENYLYRSLLLISKNKMRSELQFCLIEMARLSLKKNDGFANTVLSYIISSPASWKATRDQAQTLQKLAKPLSSNLIPMSNELRDDRSPSMHLRNLALHLMASKW